MAISKQHHQVVCLTGTISLISWMSAASLKTDAQILQRSQSQVITTGIAWCLLALCLRMFSQRKNTKEWNTKTETETKQNQKTPKVPVVKKIRQGLMAFPCWKLAMKCLGKDSFLRPVSRPKGRDTCLCSYPGLLFLYMLLRGRGLSPLPTSL